MPYSIETQNALQRTLGPKLRQLYVMIKRAEGMAEVIVQQYLSPEKASIDKEVFAATANLLGLNITLRHTKGVKGFFRPKSVGAISKDDESGLLNIPEGVVFFHEIVKNNGHYHLGRPYPPTLGGGRCGFAALAQLFEHWQHNESIPESALTKVTGEDKEAKIVKIQKKFKEIIRAGNHIIKDQPLIDQPSQDPKGPVNVGCGFGR
jgi:hypothetical protein